MCIGKVVCELDVKVIDGGWFEIMYKIKYILVDFFKGCE